MPADNGTQTVTIKYGDRIDSSIVNARHIGIHPTGIYKGGYFHFTLDDTNIYVEPLVCEITDGTYQVKVETSARSDAIAIVATKYVVLRWAYTGAAAADYMSFALVDLAGILTNDLVVGLVACTGGKIKSVSYPVRSTPNLPHVALRVEPNQPTVSSSVVIRRGNAYLSNGLKDVPETIKNLAAYSGSTIYLYLDENTGSIEVGTSAAYVNRLILAEIDVSASISESDITDKRAYITSTPKYDSGWFAVSNNGSYSKTHNLGSTAIMVQVLFRTAVGGTVSVVNMDTIGAYCAGPCITSITATTLSIRSGINYAAVVWKSALPTWEVFTSGEYRVLATRIGSD